MSWRYDEHLRPLNPRGRAGMTNRGLLGKWGPNHATDPIVTRMHPDGSEKLQMVAVQRRDTNEWAIPGGMVDEGEVVSQSLRREFEEETGQDGQGHANGQHMDKLFNESGSVV